MTDEEPMVARQPYKILMSLLLRRLSGDTAAGHRLPRGRCACHEPTVKWCGRHGQPLKQPA